MVRRDTLIVKGGEGHIDWQGGALIGKGGEGMTRELVIGGVDVDVWGRSHLPPRLQTNRLPPEAVRHPR